MNPARRAASIGVTYVEMFLVVTIVAALSTAVLPTARTLSRRASEKQLVRSLADIRAAIDAYHQDWTVGSIEASTEEGWPTDLEELTREIDFKLPFGTTLPAGDKPPPPTKVYLKRVPRDPFNIHGDDWDVSGWKARAYEDDFDATSWGGSHVYDVYSSSDRVALDGTLYETW